jgi:hypothetical protein
MIEKKACITTSTRDSFSKNDRHQRARDLVFRLRQYDDKKSLTDLDVKLLFIAIESKSIPDFDWNNAKIIYENLLGVRTPRDLKKYYSEAIKKLKNLIEIADKSVVMDVKDLHKINILETLLNFDYILEPNHSLRARSTPTQ